MDQISKTGHLAIFTANVIFGLNIIISKMLMPDFLSPMALNLFRMVGAFLLFFIASFFIKKEVIEKRDYISLFLASLFGIFINQISYLEGLSRTSPIDASLVVTLLPILAMLIAAGYLKEPITRLKVIGVIIGASGALLIILKSNTINHGASSFYGNMLCFISCFSYAFYLVFFKNLMGKYHAITIMKWMFFYASILCLPFCYKDVAATDYSKLSVNVYWSIFYVVFGATFLSYLLIGIAISKLRPTTVSMYNYVQPLVASLAAVFLGLDKLGFVKILAAFLIFFGVFLVTKSKSKADMEAGE